MARYDIREFAGMWSVIDTTTGEIAKVNDRCLEGTQLDDADDAADLLNHIEASRMGVEN